MRLRQLRMERYGHFTAASLDLDTAPGVINVIEAPNGAGKSVLRQAIQELLFGFRLNTPMNFLYDYPQLELRAQAVLPDGELGEFIRRKREKNSLVDVSGKPAGVALLRSMPRESERKRLERLFVLDSQTLRDGGKALLDTDGDLADALLSSAGDLGSSRTLARDLAARRDALAPRRKSQTPFHQTLDEWLAANTELAAALVRPVQIQEQEQRRAAAQAALEAARHTAAEAARVLDRLNRVQRCRDHIEALDTASAWLGANPGAPVLRPQATEAFLVAKLAQAKAAENLAQGRHALESLGSQAQAVQVEDAVLARAAEIDHLTSRGEQSVASRTDLPGQQLELAGALAVIDRLLRELGSQARAEDAKAEIRPAAEIEAARALVAELGVITASQAKAGAALKAHQDAMAEAEDDIAALPVATATDAVKAIVDEALADGDPARLLRDAHAEAARAAAKTGAALGQVPGWTGAADALAAIPVLAEATFLRLDKALTNARGTEAAVAKQLADREEDTRAATSRLADLTGGRALPDAAALAQARAHRDRGWGLIFARLSGRPDPAEADYAAPMPLPLAFQAAMAAADEVADRRSAEMERIGAAETLRGEITRAQAAAADAAHNAVKAVAAGAGAAAQWAAAVQPLGLEQASGLAEVRAWVAARDAVLAAAAEQAVLNDRVARLLARQTAWSADLATALGASTDPLPRLIAIAKARLDEAARAVTRRQALMRQLTGLRRKVTDAAPQAAAAQAALAGWERRWDAVAHRLGRPPGEAPTATAAVLDRLVDLAAAVGTADVARGRVGAMQTQLAAFTADAARLAAELGDGGGDPAEVAERLAGRLAAARVQAGARDSLRNQVSTAAATLDRAQVEHAAAQRSLAQAILALGVTTPDEAENRIALAAERAAQDDIVAARRSRLAEDSDQLSLAELRAEIDSHPAADILHAKRDAEANAATGQHDAEAATAEITMAEVELARLANSEGAGRAASAREAATARLSVLLDEALVQHLAATMLDEGLAEVEAAGADNALLERIGATFSALTQGSYVRLSPAIEDGDSKQFGRLIAHEPGGADKHVARLSEGTRDQLYLALRLIAIEEHVARAPALPFVADDILQTFDDERARAALEALVRLSQHVQVIVLTHHPHLLALARGLPVRHLQLPGRHAA